MKEFKFDYDKSKQLLPTQTKVVMKGIKFVKGVPMLKRSAKSFHWMRVEDSLTEEGE